MDVDREDFLGGLGSDFFDVHAARRRGDEGYASALPIQRQRNVHLALDLRARFDVNALDGQTVLRCLFRDEASADHVLRRGTHASHVAHDLHATRLTATAGMHLRLNHPHRTADRFGGRCGLVGIRRYASRGNRDAIAAEDVLRLILVQIHRHRRTRKTSILPKIAVRDQHCHDVARISPNGELIE